jgi:hypothetical protein
MDENMKELCKEQDVAFHYLLEKINRGRHFTFPGDALTTLTPKECEVIYVALVIAGGV